MENIESFWEQVKYKVKRTLPEHSYRMWIDPVEFIGYNENKVHLSSPNHFFVKRLKEKYLQIFKNEFSKLGLEEINIAFKVAFSPQNDKNRKNSDSFPAVPLTTKASRQPVLPGLDACMNNGRMLKKGFTFNDFVVGSNSEFAYAASLSLAQGKTNGSSILYLLANTGLGKSHLSQAVGHHIIKTDFFKRVYYVTAEDFTNEMIYSLKNNKIERFKEKYRKKCDVLILEDIHFLSGKAATQKELAITLDYLLDADKKIIFSGCDLPDEIPKLNAQLRSRLTLGLVTEIDAPDYATRVRILKKKAENLDCQIPRHVTEYIAQELCDNVRQLESGLFGVAARGQIMECNIDLGLAKAVLATIKSVKKRVSLDSIKRLVCKEFSISEKEIVSSSRKKRIVKPRQMGMFLSKKYTDQSIKMIGKSYNKYHATAIYAINTIESELKKKSTWCEEVNFLSEKIESGKL